MEDDLGGLSARLSALAARTREGFATRAEELRAAADRLEGGDGLAKDEIRRLAHKLRGIAANAERPALGERAGRLENALRAGGGDMAAIEGARRLASAALDAMTDAAPTAPVAAPPSAVQRPTEGLRVIALDDEPATRRLLEITLTQAGGCDARVFADAAEAMRCALDAPPDLVVVDAMMPDVDGLAFYQGLRARDIDVPVAILSAASPEELGWTLPDDPRLRWMRKPFRPAHLIAQLGDLLAGASE
ncbi:MAG: response regulator [Sandaracinaceae bacterium]